MGRQDEGQSIDICTMGMFIIDEIHFNPFQIDEDDARDDSGHPKHTSSKLKHDRSKANSSEKPLVLTNVMGGAGSYTVLGARIVAGRERAKSVGWIVDCGSDFPTEMKERIDRWETSCLFRQTPDRLTTRGWNGYGTGEQRAFKYLTPKLRIDETSLTASLLAGRSFHLICSAQRCIALVEGIIARRKSSDITERPLFVWEPVPDLCTPDEWSNCQAALKVVDVVSPNHVELAGFFGVTEDALKNETLQINRGKIEQMAHNMIKEGNHRSDRTLHVVVRAGVSGCCVCNGRSQATTWLPAYHENNSQKVVDPTGAGNTFLGGLTLALVNGKPLEVASSYGSIVSGIAIEQVGMPELVEDRWNDLSFKQRCELYQHKLDYMQLEIEL